MRIVIDPFDEKSIAAAVERLKQYERDFKAKETEFVRRLKEIGVSVARAGFATADYDGENAAAAFPYPHTQFIGSQHLYKLHIHTVRKGFVMLDYRSKLHGDCQQTRE